MVKLEPREKDDGHETDYTRITDQIFVGSDLCNGMVCPIHGEDFKRLGVSSEINLSKEKKEIPPDGVDSYTWIPVTDGYSPTQDQLDMGTSIINEAVTKGKKIYVHCKNGHGRSPTMAIAYLIRFGGKSLEEAKAFVKEKRAEVHIEETQEKELREYEKRWLK